MKNLPWNYLQPIIYLLIAVMVLIIVILSVTWGKIDDKSLAVIVSLAAPIIAVVGNKLRTVKPDEPEESVEEVK